ncbi:MAG TPA: zinc-binding dehydrogenase [Anaerolineae bacterium]|nr:zinc-binding dehydrogenase [Anaerolineae bacterium]
MAKNRAVMLYGTPNDTRVVEIERPTLQPNRVIVRLTVGAICANDWKMAFDGYRGKLPTTLGHELAGEVIAVGEHIVGYAPGDRVCVRFASAIYCGHCFYCLRGWFNLCENWISFELPGGLVEFMAFDTRLEERLLKLPDNISFEEAALIEPVACSLAGIEVSNIQPGEEVVILGAGAMGLFNLQLALLYGASRVFVVETNPFRAAIARQFGAAQVIDFKATDPIAAVRDLTAGRGCASVIECSGTLGAAAQAVQMARRKGTVCFFAGFGSQAQLTLDPNWVHYSGIYLTGSTGSTIRHAQRIINYLAAGRLQLKPLITHRFPLEGAREALALGASRGESLKILLEP